MVEDGSCVELSDWLWTHCGDPNLTEMKTIEPFFKNKVNKFCHRRAPGSEAVGGLIPGVGRMDGFGALRELYI